MHNPLEVKQHFEKWAKQQGLPIFPIFDAEGVTSLMYSNIDTTDHREFENLIIKSGTPFVIAASHDVTFAYAAYQHHIEWFRANDPDYKKHLAFLKSKANDLLSFEIGYMYQGVYFYSYYPAEWSAEFDDIEDLCSMLNDELAEEEYDEADDVDLDGLLN